MAHIGEIGKRLTVQATYKKSFEYVDYKFSYYGTTHFTHIFEDAEGNTIVWKSTNMVEYINDGEYKFITKGSTVELTGTVKEHGQYKGVDQTVVTRCKFKLVALAKTEAEIRQEKSKAQMDSLTGKDFIWEMPYRQYKEHYSDCETVVGSFTRYEDRHGNVLRDPTIKVIIREGRLKPNGVRGQRIRGYVFQTDDGAEVTYRAVCEENARKRMKKDFLGSDNWELIEVFNHSKGH
jgi:hypothetical protein